MQQPASSSKPQARQDTLTSPKTPETPISFPMTDSNPLSQSASTSSSQQSAADRSANKPTPLKYRFVPTDAIPTTKRRRIGVACKTCRKRKTRCTGEKPTCTTCAQNGQECMGYESPSPRSSDQITRNFEEQGGGDITPTRSPVTEKLMLSAQRNHQRHSSQPENLPNHPSELHGASPEPEPVATKLFLDDDYAFENTCTDDTVHRSESPESIYQQLPAQTTSFTTLSSLDAPRDQWRNGHLMMYPEGNLGTSNSEILNLSGDETEIQWITQRGPTSDSSSNHPFATTRIQPESIIAHSYPSGFESRNQEPQGSHVPQLSNRLGNMGFQHQLDHDHSHEQRHLQQDLHLIQGQQQQQQQQQHNITPQNFSTLYESPAGQGTFSSPDSVNMGFGFSDICYDENINPYYIDSNEPRHYNPHHRGGHGGVGDEEGAGGL